MLFHINQGQNNNNICVDSVVFQHCLRISLQFLLFQGFCLKSSWILHTPLGKVMFTKTTLYTMHVISLPVNCLVCNFAVHIRSPENTFSHKGSVSKSLWFLKSENSKILTYQQTDSEKYSTLSLSKKIFSQSSAFFSSQSTTI